eukprot:TRINITY_DN13543_c0_g1_i1.p1 TRINITY_DN13543_c0_g1~~TRINITY_DN13543_c0_g1_i1.p1  ORF type:complete len:128 (+),score=14.55 TRINITY_DN13543_c0_g1_i1:114-497(+)
MQIFAEPSRYIVESSHSLVTNVISRKKIHSPSLSIRQSGESGETQEGFSPQYSEVVEAPRSRGLALDRRRSLDTSSILSSDTDFIKSRKVTENSPRLNHRFYYYINDGLYGSFHCLFMEKSRSLLSR